MSSRREAEAEKWARAMSAVAENENVRRKAASAKRFAGDEAIRQETARIAAAQAVVRAAEEAVCGEAEELIRNELGPGLRAGWDVAVTKKHDKFTANLVIPYINYGTVKGQTYRAEGADANELCAALKQALTAAPPTKSSPQWERRRAQRFSGSPPEYFFGRLAPRTNHCADCKHPLDSSLHSECSACRGMICPRCVCCGCRISIWQHYR